MSGRTEPDVGKGPGPDAGRDRERPEARGRRGAGDDGAARRDDGPGPGGGGAAAGDRGPADPASDCGPGPVPAPEELGVGGRSSGPFSRRRAGAEPSTTGAADEAGGPGGTILTDVAALAAERDDYLTALQRLKADFDNYRKRVARQQDEERARAAADLVVKLLPVLDTLDLAWAHLGDGGRDGAAGEEARALGQVRAQLLDALGKEGLERVDADGVAFDPTVHDAVAHARAGDEAAGDEAAGDGGGATEVARPGGPPEPAARDEGAGAGGPGAPGEGPRGAASPGAASPGAAGRPAGGVAAESVDEVLRAGYLWRGQVLRPAMVRVRG